MRIIVSLFTTLAFLVPVAVSTAAPAEAATSRGPKLVCNVHSGPVCRVMGAPTGLEPSAGQSSYARCKDYQWIQYSGAKRAWGKKHKVTSTGCTKKANGHYGYLVKVYHGK